MGAIVTRDRLALGLIAAGVLALASCQRLEVASVVDAEGAGRRSLALVVDAERTADVDALMGVSAARGWREGTTEDTGPDGRTRQLPTFRRETRVARLADWAAASGDIQIAGAPSGGAHADVRLTNRVGVELGRGTAGRSYTYRETFAWNGLLETLAGFVAERFSASVAAAHPNLSPATVAELRGVALGVFTAAVRANAGADGDQELDETLMLDTLAGLCSQILTRARTPVEADRLREMASAAMDDKSSGLEPFVNQELPGFALAGETSLELSVTLPGRIVETNGKVGDDGTVTWSFNLGDPLAGPRECWARSQLTD